MYIATSALRRSSSASAEPTPVSGEADADARARVDLPAVDVERTSAASSGRARRRRPPPSTRRRRRAARRTRRRRSGRRCRPGAPRTADGWPTSRRTVSPAAWPRLSLTVLKSSRSMNITPTSGPPRRDLSIECWTRSAKSARLARPVTGSWNAWCASWSSNSFRSLTSRPLSTMPRTCSSWRRSVYWTSNCSQVPSRCLQAAVDHVGLGASADVRLADAGEDLHQARLVRRGEQLRELACPRPRRRGSRARG